MNISVSCAASSECSTTVKRGDTKRVREYVPKQATAGLLAGAGGQDRGVTSANHPRALLFLALGGSSLYLTQKTGNVRTNFTLSEPDCEQNPVDSRIA